MASYTQNVYNNAGNSFKKESHITFDNINDLQIYQEDYVRSKGNIKKTNELTHYTSSNVDRELQGGDTNGDFAFLTSVSYNADKTFAYYPFKNRLLCVNTETLEIIWIKSFADWIADDKTNSYNYSDTYTHRSTVQKNFASQFNKGSYQWLSSLDTGYAMLTSFYTKYGITDSIADIKAKELNKFFEWDHPFAIKYAPYFHGGKLYLTNGDVVQNSYQHFLFVVDANNGKLKNSIPLRFPEGEFADGRYLGTGVTNLAKFATASLIAAVAGRPKDSNNTLELFMGNSGVVQYVSRVFGVNTLQLNPEEINLSFGQGSIIKMTIDLVM